MWPRSSLWLDATRLCSAEGHRDRSWLTGDSAVGHAGYGDGRIFLVGVTTVSILWAFVGEDHTENGGANGTVVRLLTEAKKPESAGAMPSWDLQERTAETMTRRL